MKAGIIAGVTWAIETIILGVALSMSSFLSSEKAILLAPFVSTFIHDLCSAIWILIYHGLKGNIKSIFMALKTRSGKCVSFAAVMGGPIGMTGYVLAVANMGASIGAVSTAIFPAVGAVLACVFLKEKMAWYRWMFLIFSLFGVYGLSYSPEIEIRNFALGFLGTLMCSFGWGIEAVIIARCVKNEIVTDEIALQIRQVTSALIYGIIILPLINGWRFMINIFVNQRIVIIIIAVAAFFATVSYLFYYKSISQIGASKSMALNITYSAWAVIISIAFLGNVGLINPITLFCTLIVLIFGILAGAEPKSLI